jgi:hypothetical protein
MCASMLQRRSENGPWRRASECRHRSWYRRGSPRAPCARLLHRNVPASVLFKQSTARPLFPVRADVAIAEGHLVGFRQGIANSDGNVQIDYRLGGIDRDRIRTFARTDLVGFRLDVHDDVGGFATRNPCSVADPIGVMCLVKSMLPQPSEWAGFGAGRHFFTIV